jgi:TRAP transporter TAXI family solute receptor
LWIAGKGAQTVGRAQDDPQAQHGNNGRIDVTLIRYAVASALAWFAVAPAHAQVITIVTTPAGSFTNSIGAAIAKALVERAGLKATVSPQQSHGQESVNDGSADLSLATISDVQQYVTGTVDWEGKGPKKNIRLISRTVPIMTVGYVRLDSDIKSLKDVKGKRVPSGFPAQRAVQRVVLAQLAGAGLTEADVRPVPARNIVSSADDFAAGKSDVFWFALGSAKVKQVAASVGGLRGLPIETSPDALKAMKKYVPGSYAVVLKPSPALEEIRSEIPVMAYDVVFFTRANLSDDTVYKITKAVHENKKDMAAVFPALNRFEPENMARNYDDLEYHPGAIKYYREKGMWPPKAGS